MARRTYSTRRKTTHYMAPNSSTDPDPQYAMTLCGYRKLAGVLSGNFVYDPEIAAGGPLSAVPTCGSCRALKAGKEKRP